MVFLNFSGAICRFASILWNLSIPLKIRCFLWLCWKHKLNTRDAIGKKLGKFLDGCAICDTSPETIDHLYSFCPLFSKIWSSMCVALSTLCPQSTFRYICMDWTQSKFPKSSQLIILMLFSAIAWRCWRERNAGLFFNKASSTQVVACDALSLFRDWSILCNSNQLKIFGAVWSKIKRVSSSLPRSYSHHSAPNSVLLSWAMSRFYKCLECYQRS